MKKTLLLFACGFSVWAQDYKLETVASTPEGLPAAYGSVVAAQGYRVSGPKGSWCEDPVHGAHQGAAPQRDFALLTPVANDAGPNSMPAFDKLVTASRTTGTAHPCVFSLEPPPGTSFPALPKDGDTVGG